MMGQGGLFNENGENKSEPKSEQKNRTKGS